MNKRLIASSTLASVLALALGQAQAARRQGPGKVLRHRQGRPERLRQLLGHALVRGPGQGGQRRRRLEVRGQGHLRDDGRLDGGSGQAGGGQVAAAAVSPAAARGSGSVSSALPSVSRGSVPVRSIARSTASSQACEPLDLVMLRPMIEPSGAQWISTSTAGLPGIAVGEDDVGPQRAR